METQKEMKYNESSNNGSILRGWLWVILIGSILFLGSSVYMLVVSWEQIISPNTFINIYNLIAQMLPPDFTVVSGIGVAVLETIAMSVMATFLSVIIAFPLSFLAASNTSPHPSIQAAVKAIFNILRTIPELIMGIIFVAAVGFGILPGILALGLSSVGMLGKFYAEAIEKVDKGLNEAVQSAGGSRFHIIIFSIIPQVISHSVDFSLYRWEHNFRASTVVGLIGAGGLGFELISSLRLLQYQEVLAILIIVFVLVQLVDTFGNVIRRKLLEGERI
ncbi:phosphonate ABC transporter, permease protein PhnE [Oceanobacillus damuensis]|uniref:phosphonate ABC transporter, permease protein PhnE n=1 Tax=Oceanobacillus damuensis TaxID=937928 RepID=UPI000A0455E0|nr:phosphonate ABC transporter, permease protein PhnE [Oceanobacillus damuensis]